MASREATPAGGRTAGRARVRPSRVTAPDLPSHEIADIALGALSLGVAAAVRTTTLTADLARSTVRRLPVPRIRARSERVDDVLGALDRRGRVERSALPALVRDVLTRFDLTELVLEFVDLDRIANALDIEAVIARVDLDTIIDRLDLIGIAGYVVDGIDMKGLIRDSSGSVATGVVHDVRAQSMNADRLVERAIDAVLLRRNGRKVAVTPTPGDGDEVDGRA
jgi:hypothetical protein